jgi:hypothetical protein
VHHAVVRGYRKDVMIRLRRILAAARCRISPFRSYDLAGAGLDDQSMRKFLSYRLTVMVGTEDVDNTHPIFPKEPAACIRIDALRARASLS